MVDPDQNPVVRSITTVSDNVGTLQYASIQGVEKSATPKNQFTLAEGTFTPPPPFANLPNQIAPTCDASLWFDAAVGDPGPEVNQYYTRRLKSIRHHFALRTNDLAMEIGVEGSGFRIGLVSFTSKGGGLFRPQDGAVLTPTDLKVD